MSKLHLDVSTGTVYGKRYITVQPVSEEWTDQSQEWDAMLEWCVNMLGPVDTIWKDPVARWYANNARFWFREEIDATMFLLKWG